MRKTTHYGNPSVCIVRGGVWCHPSEGASASIAEVSLAKLEAGRGETRRRDLFIYKNINSSVKQN